MRALEVDGRTGLSAAEAAQRLERDGQNVLRSAPPVPMWRRVLAQFRDPLIYLLLAAIAISLVGLGRSRGATACRSTRIVIAAIVVVNAVLGFVQEAKAESAVAALARMTAVTSAVLRDGRVAARAERGAGSRRRAGARRRRCRRRGCALAARPPRCASRRPR